MDYLQNHIWCGDSNWGGDYHCRHLVSISSYDSGCEDDWESLTTTAKVFNKDSYEMLSAYYEESGRVAPDREDDLFKKRVYIFKGEVVDWLHANVTDCKDMKGWCIRSESDLTSGSNLSLHVFFQRRSDAMKFIKVWSKWKKPINYCQYFSDVRKTLNLETLKYEV